MCVRAQIAALDCYTMRIIESSGKQAKRPEVEITNTSCAEEDQQPPQLSLDQVQAPQGSFRQPSAAELSILTSWKLRYARSQAQELSNEFARLLNRGSSLE